MDSRKTPSRPETGLTLPLREEPLRARRPRGLVSEIVESLATSIREGQLRPGDKLPTEAEIMAPAVERFFARGAGPPMMNIVLSGPRGEAEAHFKVPGHRVVAAGDLLLYSLEITGAGGYWVEFSRPLLRGNPSATTQKMAEAYPEALQAARKLMRTGELASNVHRAIAETFTKYGFSLGHLSGHSIGTTMIECPAIGANSEVPLEENMIFSLHPQVVDQDGKVCLYTQDTYRIAKTEGECLANVPWRFFSGQETKESVAR